MSYAPRMTAEPTHEREARRMKNEQSPPPEKKRKAKFPKADQSLEFEYLGKLREEIRVRNPLLSDRLYYLSV